MSEEKKSTLIKAASLWRHTSREGNEFLSGNWGSVRVLIFGNRSKKGEKSPDYYMFLAERQQPEKPTAEGAPQSPDNESDATAF